jgi:hypothetical protein
MPETMTTAEKITAIEESGWPIAFDGCHKIYFLQDDDRRAQAEEYGYAIYPSVLLKELINQSCFLVFVTRWGFDNADFEHEWNIEQGSEDIYEAAGAE